MGLFSRHEEVDEPSPVVPDKSVAASNTPSRRSTLFGRRRSEESNVTHNSVSTNQSSPRLSGVLHRGSILHRGDREDPSISAARERVMGAEAAEQDADKALMTARAAVREAKDQVKRLEREAEEEARVAKIKQKQAASLSKRGQLLGRMYSCDGFGLNIWLSRFAQVMETHELPSNDHVGVFSGSIYTQEPFSSSRRVSAYLYYCFMFDERWCMGESCYI
jgi:hypothetical protein